MENDNRRFKKIVFFICLLCGVLVRTVYLDASWSTSGPYGGNITALAMSKTNPDIMYAGTPAPNTNGVYKTLDGGETWTEMGLSGYSIKDVQVDPLNPDIVYVGTTRNLYKSENGGIDWTPISLQLDSDVSVIVIDPHNPIIYLGTVGNYGSDSPFGVLYKSVDGGENWQTIINGADNEEGVKDILIDIDNSSHIYVGLQSCETSGVNFAKLEDGGVTGGFTTIGPDYLNDVVALAMTPAGSESTAIYAIVEGDDVYKSTDGGDSWTPTSTPFTFEQGPHALAVDPNNQDVVYAGTHRNGGEICRTNDGADTWSIIANDLPNGGPLSVVIDPQNSDVYVGLYECAVYKSENGGESWQRLGLGYPAYINDLAIDPSSSDKVFAVKKGLGALAATTDAGKSWNYLVGSPKKLGAVAIDPQNPSTVWVGDGSNASVCYEIYDPCGFNSYVYRTIDAGGNWEKIYFYTAHCIAPHYQCYSSVNDILIKDDDSEALLVGMSQWEGEMRRTTDGGQTWDTASMSSCTALASDPYDPNIIYWGKANIGQVFKYTDVWGSISRTEITPAGGIGAVKDIEIASDSKVYVAASDGLWKRDETDWTKLPGLPSDDITALAIDRSTTPDIVFAGTGEDGVFVSKNGGITWLPFNEDLGNLSITKLAISRSRPKILYAGTEYGGVWSQSINPPCEGDFDNDADVDSSDLAALASGAFDENDLAAFASELGRIDCGE